MMLVPAASLISGFRTSFQGGPICSILPSSFLESASLESGRTRMEGVARTHALQSESRCGQTQQRLVPPAVDVPGFRIESVYKPAAHVGGDFFYIRPLERGGVLVVVGDVSGKGLKAAMTVNLVIGALRTMPPLPPTRILAALNRGLVGQMQGGFVTCCAVRVDRGGAMRQSPTPVTCRRHYQRLVDFSIRGLHRVASVGDVVKHFLQIRSDPKLLNFREVSLEMPSATKARCLAHPNS